MPINESEGMIMMSPAEISSAMSHIDFAKYNVVNEISVQLVDNALSQAEVAMQGLLEMLPPVGRNEVGGLLDVRA